MHTEVNGAKLAKNVNKNVLQSTVIGMGWFGHLKHSFLLLFFLWPTYFNTYSGCIGYIPNMEIGHIHMTFHYLHTILSIMCKCCNIDAYHKRKDKKCQRKQGRP